MSAEIFECELCGSQYSEDERHVAIGLEIQLHPYEAVEFLGNTTTLGVCCGECWDTLTPQQLRDLTWPAQPPKFLAPSVPADRKETT